MSRTVLPSALDLARLHLDILYRRTADGLITASRDPEVTPPPVHLFRTVDGNIWAFGEPAHGLARELDSLLRELGTVVDICAREPDPPIAEQARALAFEHIRYRGPAFVAGEPVQPAFGVTVIDSVRSLPTEEQGPLAWISRVQERELPLALVRDREFGGRVVSVCHSARSTEAGAEAGVETAPEARRRGFGKAAVAAWAAAIQASGRLAFYSTEWENAPSRKIAARLGFECYGEDVHVPLTSPK
ncbi:MAG: GNAT family N-acetyltransferase [Dehalococcoidia bacterium]